MSEPLTAATGITAGTAGVTLAAYFPEATPAVMMCSLAGAALYVLTSDPHKFWKQIIFALISFISGIYCSGFVSEIIAGLLNAALGHLTPPVQVKITPAVGALVASVVSITVLLKILSRAKNTPPGAGGE